MTAQDAFIRKILAEPADDTPRLVYADWLDEHAGTVPCPICRGPGFNRGGLGGPIGCTRCRGELAVSDGSRERAEFIRVQVELARNEDVIDKHVRRLMARQRELWVGCNAAWFPKGTIEAFKIVGDLLQNRYGKTLGAVRRGFVAEVRCDLATLLGGACGRCGGVGLMRWYTAHGDNDESDCPDCKGTGRVEGVAKALFLSHPITGVVLTGLSPYHNGAGWCWFDPDRTPPYNDVPANANPPRDVYRLLTGYQSGRSRWRGYNSQLAANKALSRAVVDRCRRIADLPELEWPGE